ncbi:MAG TPA: hypothetical protein IAB45_06810 [Candidatus Onthousia faecavium]|nr:hypothetical protein [Candidatus Onthousia faecavium]
MKKIFLWLLCVSLLIGITGCGNNKKVATAEDLESVNNEIIAYFQTNGTSGYENYVFNYVDEENNVVVVGLLDNSEKEQERFKETIVDSNLIKFVKSEKLVHENDNQNSKDLKTFIRTYEILNVAESNDTNYIYLTIRQFQGEEVQTVKVEKALCPAIEEGKNYEFTLKQKRKPEDNILSIFNNSSIVSIIETDKIGLEQIQDSI